MVKLVTKFLFVFPLVIASVGDSRTLRVAEDGSGDFTSVVSAVQAAQPGDTVQVGEGHYYTEGILLDRPLVLLGAGADRTMLLCIGSVIHVKAEGCVVEGFTLLVEDLGTGSLMGGPVVVMSCSSSSPRISKNTFGGAAIEVWSVVCAGNSSPVIVNNNFGLGAVKDYGVYLKDNPNTVHAEQNWWGTTEEQQIQEWIWDGADQPGLGVVDYAPWLGERWRQGTTGVLPVTFGQLKAWFLHEVR